MCALTLRAGYYVLYVAQLGTHGGKSRKIQYRGSLCVSTGAATHTRPGNIKNEGFLLRRLYDRKRAPFCHLYMPRRRKGGRSVWNSKRSREQYLYSQNYDLCARDFVLCIYWVHTVPYGEKSKSLLPVLYCLRKKVLEIARKIFRRAIATLIK